MALVLARIYFSQLTNTLIKPEKLSKKTIEGERYLFKLGP